MPKVEQRLVLLAGPHKSGLSKVHRFFRRHISNHPEERSYLGKTTLEDWTWPVYPYAVFSEEDEDYDRNPFDDLVRINPSLSFLEQQDQRRALLSTILAVWGHGRVDPDRLSPYSKFTLPARVNHMILGTPEFGRFGATPYSHRDGLAMIQTLMQILQPMESTIVVIYPTPRYWHWLSLVTKLVGRRATYHQFICDSYMTWDHGEQKLYYNLSWEYLHSISNPLGLVQDLVNRGWNVTLIETNINGLSSVNTTLTQLIACQVMKVPCTPDGEIERNESTLEYLQGNESIALLGNESKRKETLPTVDPDEYIDYAVRSGLTHHQIQQMEEWFRHRDCSYQHTLQHHPRLTVLFQAETSKLWSNCSKTWHHYSTPVPLADTTWFSQLLQAQLNCSKNIQAIQVVFPQSSGNAVVPVLIGMVLLLGATIVVLLRRWLLPKRRGIIPTQDRLNIVF